MYILMNVHVDSGPQFYKSILRTFSSLYMVDIVFGNLSNIFISKPWAMLILIIWNKLNLSKYLNPESWLEIGRPEREQ